MLDNFRDVKAYWIMLTLPIAQLALGFGADDIDGTVSEEKITHAAGGADDQIPRQERADQRHPPDGPDAGGT